ncbi:MAG: ribonuclease R [Patescibacteria group bacterium]|nr:ribonuclease R [Patescibacteria group bacterium]MDE1946153.1 ribonuclease R [Patescibacteria group bacterium]
MERHKKPGHGRTDHHFHTRAGGHGKMLTGTIRAVRGQVALFLAEDGKTEAEISSRELRTAMGGDSVEISLIGKKSVSGKEIGVVTRVLSRAKTLFVGVVEKTDKGVMFVPDDHRLKPQVKIVGPEAAKLADNDKVRIRMTKWLPWPQASEAEVADMLGTKGDNETEMTSMAIERGFDINFPDAVARESHAIFEANRRIPAEEYAVRRDMRDTLTFTIDPKTAKDFDDAISFKKLPNGTVEIGVHIADVSHYVREKTELDREAYKRGCSVYLPDRTIPMLPFELSDELCSLNENEEKLAFSAIFEMDEKAKIISRWFGRTVIKSAKRFTYESAQEAINDKNVKHSDVLNELNRIAKILRKEKWQKGAIDFEQEEIAFDLDASGKPIRIYKKERLDTHKLVEEYMLLANREVAEFVYKAEHKSGKLFPLPYRIHGEPDRERIADLAVFVRALGHELVVNKNGSVSGRDLQALFAQVEGKAEEGLVKTAAIRSMAKAIYSTENIGHFGLAFEYYAHFTSPIRRYPDLLTHRMLATILSDKKTDGNALAFYDKACLHATDQEIKAAEAERDGRKYKQIEFMQDKIGKVFDGMVTGVTEWGIYAEDTETKAEGMIRLADMKDDFYQLDAKNYSIIGEKTKKKYQLGQKIKIKLVNADLDRRIMDWEIVQ